MNAEIITEDVGRGTVEANLALAVEQGRIGEGDKPRWRQHYQRVGYEAATQDLISRKIAHNAAAKSYSEQQWEAYARATFVIPPSTGYARSV
jgi:hypothetical protein